jgi:hypothetical protein
MAILKIYEVAMMKFRLRLLAVWLTKKASWREAHAVDIFRAVFSI